jgi:hypothetical protein
VVLEIAGPASPNRVNRAVTPAIHFWAALRRSASWVVPAARSASAAVTSVGSVIGDKATVPSAAVVAVTLQFRPQPAGTLSGRPECACWQVQARATVSG